MSSPWYIARGRQKVGPHTYEEMRRMAASEQLLPSDMVLNEGSRQWVPAGDVPGLTFDTKKGEPTGVTGKSKPYGWYFARNGQRFGPFAFDQFRQMATSGLLSPHDMVLNEEVGKWVSASAVEGFFVRAPLPATGEPVVSCTRPGTVALPGSRNEREVSARTQRPSPTTDGPTSCNPVSEVTAEGGRDAVPPVRSGEASPSRPSPLNVLWAIASLLSVPFFCLNEFIGRPFLMLAGLIWVAVGVRGVVTGKTPSFTRGEARRAALSRVAGVPVALLGLLMIVGGARDMFIQLLSTLRVGGPATRADEPAKLAAAVKPLILQEWQKVPEMRNATIQDVFLVHKDGKTYTGFVNATVGGRAARLTLEVVADRGNILWKIEPSSSAPDHGTLVEIKGSELYYTSAVTEEEARKLGAFLDEEKYFDSGRASVQLNKSDGTYEVRLVVKKGIEQDPEVIATMKQWASDISKKGFGSAPVDIHLCDENLQTVRVVVPER